MSRTITVRELIIQWQMIEQNHGRDAGAKDRKSPHSIFKPPLD